MVNTPASYPWGRISLPYLGISFVCGGFHELPYYDGNLLFLLNSVLIINQCYTAALANKISAFQLNSYIFTCKLNSPEANYKVSMSRRNETTKTYKKYKVRQFM
jgi:hypothetical protein